MSVPLIDSHGRILQDLRISVTDRCNFRCLYCLPETEAALNFYRGRWANAQNSPAIARSWTPKASLLSFEEIARFVGIACRRGIHKIRVTGGEPLLRKDLHKLIALIAAHAAVRDLAMTSNGFSFAQHALALRDAGLHRMTFSLDSLRPEMFRKMTGRDGLKEVLGSIELARALGLKPVKVNAVIIRGMNDGEIPALAEFARSEALSLRFIEYMPLDSARAWQKDMVVPGREILALLQQHFPLEPCSASTPSETARRWRIPGSEAEIGIIAPVSEPFCGHCNRLRLTADGQIRTCLFSTIEHDLRDRMRRGDSDEDLSAFLDRTVWQKEDRHHIGEPGFQQPERSMSCIGG